MVAKDFATISVKYKQVNKLLTATKNPGFVNRGIFL